MVGKHFINGINNIKNLKVKKQSLTSKEKPLDNKLYMKILNKLVFHLNLK
jgi:hypothetical protein